MFKLVKILFIVFIAAVAFPVVSSADVELGGSAPDFTLIDSNGAQRSLAEFTGQYIVLEWFNPQCPFVRKHYDTENMQNLQGTYTAMDVAWLSIDSSAEGNQGHLLPEGAKQFIEENNVRSTAVLLDPQGDVGRLYGAKTTPHMFIIDPDGKLVYQGAIDDISSADQSDVAKAKNYVAEILNLVLSGEPISAFATKSYGCSVKY